MIIIVDSKEQRPFDLSWCDHKVKVGNLITGDYSIHGHENNKLVPGVGVTIERKSLQDLYGTLGQGRDRFRREFERMADFKFACVIIEADFHIISQNPPIRSKLKPKVVTQTIWSWMVQYRIPFIACPNREFAARATVRLLEQFNRHFGAGA